MPLRYAIDMPEARSKLLTYLDTYAANDWALASLRSPVHLPPAVPAEPRPTTMTRLASWTRNLIAGADLWWIHPDLTELAGAAANTLPAFRCHPGMLPSGTGLLAWAKPVHWLYTTPTPMFAARAIAWSADEAGVWLIGYDETATLPAGHPLGPRLGWLAESTSIYLPFRDELKIATSKNPGPHELHSATWVRCAIATWLLIGQQITTASDAKMPAPTERRKLARRGHPHASARIVAITPTGEHGATGQPGDGGREYRNQWLVSGHWRLQPWGPGRQLRRPIWIDPYIKGPDGAPLLHIERVHTARAR